MASIVGEAYLGIIEAPPAGRGGDDAAMPPRRLVERRSGRVHPAYDEDEVAAGLRPGGLFMATATALVFWAVIALMILFILV
jgi:hypothetical protein